MTLSASSRQSGGVSRAVELWCPLVWQGLWVGWEGALHLCVCLSAGLGALSFLFEAGEETGAHDSQKLCGIRCLLWGAWSEITEIFQKIDSFLMI